MDRMDREARSRFRREMRRLRRLDLEAIELGYTADTGYRPGYVMRLTELIERTGDEDAAGALERLLEVSHAIREAKEEQAELLDLLRMFEAEITYIERERVTP